MLTRCFYKHQMHLISSYCFFKYGLNYLLFFLTKQVLSIQAFFTMWKQSTLSNFQLNTPFLYSYAQTIWQKNRAMLLSPVFWNYVHVRMHFYKPPSEFPSCLQQRANWDILTYLKKKKNPQEKSPVIKIYIVKVHSCSYK